MPADADVSYDWKISRNSKVVVHHTQGALKSRGKTSTERRVPAFRPTHAGTFTCTGTVSTGSLSCHQTTTFVIRPPAPSGVPSFSFDTPRTNDTSGPPETVMPLAAARDRSPPLERITPVNGYNSIALPHDFPRSWHLADASVIIEELITLNGSVPAKSVTIAARG